MYDKIISFPNLLKAYYKARRHKRYRRRLQKMEVDFENRLLIISSSLKNQTYKPKKYHRFVVFEPKMRQISAPAFIDRIIHHAIINIIEPLFETQFIPNSFACRRNKGTHFGMLKIAECYKIFAAKYPIFYVLKCDVKQYFASIDHKILFQLLSQTLTCPKTLQLLKTIIESYENLSGKGMPIGNLTSQLFANVYMHQLDLYVRDVLREPNYFRYMDDFIVFSPDKEYLKKLRSQIRDFLCKNLKLSLHPKKANICCAEQGVDFLGYFIKKDVILLRKKTLRRYKKRHKRRLKLLMAYKKKLKKQDELLQLSLFSGNFSESEQTIYIKEKIEGLKHKLRSSRNSLKGFLRYSQHEKLATGGVKVNKIIVPNIFSKKKKNV
ncbi:MAG: reverse transcriptase/maturase family protein [Candidatus Levybacteria bacterium]|nr:reverse transcriptase/maturase family protein [Candidatus Levybacteria bacterium]